MLATGYITLWQRLHQAEEALVEVEPTAQVIAGAVHDELRLVGSTIANSQALLAKLRRAVAVLSGPGARYLTFPPATDAREAV
ncbi:MAG: hypothetical protein M3328_16615, partial [Chloroflexota bacterium]|nr:hypothetical protein [Chloroflexota bacterium]